MNRILIVLGVLAFGLIVTDRVMEAFKADDLPEDLASEEAMPEGTGGQQTASSALTEETADTVGNIDNAILDALPMPETEALVTLENLFGSPVVLVSAAEPSYVVTADERRFDVGGVVDDTTTLAGVTSHQLIFEQTGDLLVISLPEPVSQ
ncbi:hypothetical protein ACUNV4_18605 [Granulosicoccus sp. 3-233]|uniref:hypothetical protein n=1 Tax=Granulosicoccus sp. 3-233 TaxID=3417969 RepID=UPI003D326BFE